VAFKRDVIAFGGDGACSAVLRIYQPKPEVQNGNWKAPPLRKAS
jgi:hypothetical protein